MVKSELYSLMDNECVYYHVTPEVANVAILNHAYADVTAISGPLQLTSHELQDHTIFHMAVPASWGINASDIFLYAVTIIVIWTLLSFVAGALWTFFTSKYFRGTPDARTILDKELDDQGQIKQIREWEELKKRKYREDTQELRRRSDARWLQRLKHLFKPGGSIDREE